MAARPWVVTVLAIGGLAGCPVPALAGFEGCFPIRLVTRAPKPDGEVLTIARHARLSGTRVETEEQVVSSRCGLGTGQLLELADRLVWSGTFASCPGESLAFTVRGRCGALRMRGSRSRISRPHRRRRVRAKPSVCGDGVIDLSAGEVCERRNDAACRPTGSCDACRCVGTPGPAPSVSIDEVSCSAGLIRAPGSCGVGAMLAVFSSGGGRAQGPVGTILAGQELACDAWSWIDCDSGTCCGRGGADPESTAWSETGWESPIGCGPAPPEIPATIGVRVEGPFDTAERPVTRSFVCTHP